MDGIREGRFILAGHGTDLQVLCSSGGRDCGPITPRLGGGGGGVFW
jgi:hypothetical protein